MTTIKAYTGYNERTGTHYYRTFEIVDTLPEVGETCNQGDYKCTEINEVYLDCEQGKDDVYNYNYYAATMQSCDPDDGEPWNEYFAVKKDEE